MGTLKQEIDAILNDSSLDYETKGQKLSVFVTKQELATLLHKPTEPVALKEPLKPNKTGMRTLPLSIHSVYYEAIATGVKKAEYRDYKDYYIKKCTYVENGKRYLVPFDTITFYVGKGRNAKSMTVALTNITCDGSFFVFHLGEILHPKK